MILSFICKGCWSQMHVPIVLRGPLAFPFRLLGLRPSRMNPNLCTLCETSFQTVKRTRQIVVPATILFADVRGYTDSSLRLDHTEIARMLGGFYENCGNAIWERDGIVNKLIGDAILAIFNWPIRRGEHVRLAVDAALDLQVRCRLLKRQIPPERRGAAFAGIGVGIHTGQVSVGDVGESCRDYTAIGPVVNLASRLQAAAQAGEILVTEEVYAHVRDRFPDTAQRLCQLKGVDQPVRAFVLTGADTAPGRPRPGFGSGEGV